MVIVKASEESEAGEMPSEKILSRMIKYNEELTEIELRPIFEAEDFGDEFTPERREKEQRLRDKIKSSH